MKKNMLEYTKELLLKVSFDVKLFRKELAKAYNNLVEDEIEELKQWVLNNFENKYYLSPIYITK